MNRGDPFQNPGSTPSHNRSVSPPTDRRSFARAANAQTASTVVPQGGMLYPAAPGMVKNDRAQSPQSAVVAMGPPWLFAYVLLEAKSYELNEQFQLSVRSLDRASGEQIHFQDIGNPRVHGEVYQKIRSPELAAQDEREADLYLQEVTRLGGDWHQRLVETEKLACLLGLGLDKLPCIAFRTSPFERAVTLGIPPEWYATRAARWAFVDTLKAWVSTGITWIPQQPAPTTAALLEVLPDKLARLVERIDEAVRATAAAGGTATATSTANVFRLIHGIWEISYAGNTVHLPDQLGLRYLALILRARDQRLSAITLRNVAYRTGDEPFLGEEQEAAVVEETGPVTGKIAAAEGDEKNSAQSSRFVSDDSFDRVIKDFTHHTLADKQALQEYQKRLADLDREIHAAERKANLDEAQRLDLQRAELEKHVKKLRSRGGRIRSFSDEEKRANQSVPLAIRRALALLQKPHPRLYAHLSGSLTLGPEIHYHPEPPIFWTA